MKDVILNVETNMIECNGIQGVGSDCSRNVFDALNRLGCRFFNFSPQYPLDKFGEQDGDILPNAGLCHHALAQSARLLVKGAENVPTEGDGTFSFTASIRRFTFNQAVHTGNVESFDELAARQVAFLNVMIPLFRPQFSTIDQLGENVGSPEPVITKRTLAKLCWYNVFGPAYCDKFGRDVFMNAQVYQTEDLGQNGVAVRATENLSEWLDEPNHEMVEYFRSRISPGIKPYRARRSPVRGAGTARRCPGSSRERPVPGSGSDDTNRSQEDVPEKPP